VKAHRLVLWAALIALCITAVLCAGIAWQSVARGQPFLAAFSAAVGALMVWLVVFIVQTLLWDAGQPSRRTRTKF